MKNCSPRRQSRWRSFGEKHGDDHADAVVHEAGGEKFPDSGVDDGEAGLPFLAGLEFLVGCVPRKATPVVVELVLPELLGNGGEMVKVKFPPRQFLQGIAGERQALGPLEELADSRSCPSGGLVKADWFQAGGGDVPICLVGLEMRARTAASRMRARAAFSPPGRQFPMPSNFEIARCPRVGSFADASPWRGSCARLIVACPLGVAFSRAEPRLGVWGVNAVGGAVALEDLIGSVETAASW